MVTSSSRFAFAAVVSGVLLASPAARAQEAARPHHSPPPEAFTACERKTTSEACSLSFGDRAVAGTCAPADDNRLFCRPSGPPPPRGPRPLPPEAVAACSGRAESASCSVALPDRTVDGTCAASEEGALVCRPSAPPPPRG